MRVVLFLHLLGASVWAGGHLVLALSVLPRAWSRRDHAAVAAFEERFEPIGIPALVLQIVTGLWLAHRAVPSYADWFGFGSDRATLVGVKLVLLGLTAVLAVHARWKVVPDLDEERLGPLAAHIIAVTVLAVLFVYVGVSFRFGSLT